MERAMVRRRAALCGSIVLVLFAGAASVQGHHSFAMFDTASQVTLTGVVTSFEWTNPHAYIEIDVPDGAATKHWTIELGSTSILMRGGWKFNTLKHGDKVTAVVNPLRNGEPGSLLSRITLPDGKVLGNGGPPPAAGGPARGGAAGAAPATPAPQR
jgi:hypothetical protein